MMSAVLAKVRIEDFDRFWEVFSTRGAEQRAAFGSRGARVFRHGEDENEIWVLFDWDPAAYERFIADGTSQEIMRAAGLLGPPETVPLQELGRHPS